MSITKIFTRQHHANCFEINFLTIFSLDNSVFCPQDPECVWDLDPAGSNWFSSARLWAQANTYCPTGRYKIKK